MHFNVGGAQAIEDSLKVVEKCMQGKSLMLAFMGGYHGRHPCSHRDHKQFSATETLRPFQQSGNLYSLPLLLPVLLRQGQGELRLLMCQQFENLFETEYYGVIDK